MKRFLILMIAVFMLQPSFANAQGAEAAPQFFSALQDVPLMPGLSEVPEMTVVFDKPEGRIVESAAALDQAGASATEAFYAQTLPQLGWKQREKNLYTRQGEELVLSFEGGFLRVMVRPAE